MAVGSTRAAHNEGSGQVIRNGPPPLELPEAGHFVQEAGEIMLMEAMRSFGSAL
jgi:hypothetical protein